MTLSCVKRLGRSILSIAATVFLTTFVQASNAPDMEGEPTSFWGDIVFVKDELREHEGTVSKMKINVCDYDSRSFDELEMRIKEEVLGRKNSDMSELFSNVPVYEGTVDFNPKMRQFAGIKATSALVLSFECNVADGNKNRWTLNAHISEAKEIIKVDLYLLYSDEKFAKRNEPIKRERYGKFDDIARAIESLVDTYSYDRSRLRREMIAGEFWFLLSCEGDDTVSDVFFLPPPPPDSLPGLLGIYITPDAPPEIVASFSKEDGSFLGALSRDRRPAEEKCTWIEKSYDEKLIDWIMTDYPDSWFAKYLESSK